MEVASRISTHESGTVLPGSLDSHEIADSRHPLLLSQAAQAKLCFTKSSRKGTITLDDYEDQGLEVARQIRTGLFMVRIDHLLVEQILPLPEQLRCLLLEQPDVIESSDEDDNYDSHGYVASSRPKARKFPTATLEANTVIMSCGMLNFEASAYSKGSSKEFHDHFGNRKVETAHFEKHPK